MHSNWYCIYHISGVARGRLRGGGPVRNKVCQNDNHKQRGQGCRQRLVSHERATCPSVRVQHSNYATARNASSPNPRSTTRQCDARRHRVIDVIETDSEWERSIFGPISRADTTTYVELDDEEDSDAGMDMPFFTLGPPPQIRVPALKPKPQPNTASRPPALTQRTRTGPPPLGMCRAPQLQPSQYIPLQAPRP